MASEQTALSLKHGERKIIPFNNYVAVDETTGLSGQPLDSTTRVTEPDTTTSSTATSIDKQKLLKIFMDLYQSTQQIHNSTVDLDYDADILSEITMALNSLKGEHINFGTHSTFYDKINDLVIKYGSKLTDYLEQIIGKQQLTQEVAIFETLRYLGENTEKRLHREILWLLQKALKSQSKLTREGAVLGIASLDDPDAIPYLEHALKHERIHSLRDDMQQVLEQLEATSLEVEG